MLFSEKDLKSPGFSNVFLPVIGYNSVIQGAFEKNADLAG
jgi:hypothetical protein